MTGRLALVCAALLAALGGCASVQKPEPAPDPWVRADGPKPAGESESLLMYFEHVRRLAPAELGDELDAARQLYATRGSEFARVRLAMALSVPGTASNDDARALETLDPVLRNQNSPLRAIAFIVAAQIQERRRSLALQQRLESEQRRGGGLQQRFEDEQRRAAAWQQRFEDEQKRGQSLQQKLDALRSLEKSLLERETDARMRRR